MRQKKEIILLSCFILLCTIILAAWADAGPEKSAPCLKSTPCSTRPHPPVQDFNWNPISRGIMHIST
jgi:hypothetical protein